MCIKIRKKESITETEASKKWSVENYLPMK